MVRCAKCDALSCRVDCTCPSTMPGPRKLPRDVRLALSYDALNMICSRHRRPQPPSTLSLSSAPTLSLSSATSERTSSLRSSLMRAIRSARRNACSRPCRTLGPQKRKNGCTGKEHMAGYRSSSGMPPRPGDLAERTRIGSQASRAPMPVQQHSRTWQCSSNSDSSLACALSSRHQSMTDLCARDALPEG
jgi:hypothetical protein